MVEEYDEEESRAHVGKRILPTTDKIFEARIAEVRRRIQRQEGRLNMLCKKHEEKFPDVGSIHEGDEEFEVQYFLFGEGIVLSAEQAIAFRAVTADVLKYALEYDNYPDYEGNLQYSRQVTAELIKEDNECPVYGPLDS